MILTNIRGVNFYKGSIINILFLLISIGLYTCSPDKVKPKDDESDVLDLPITIPLGGNSWVINSTEQDAVVINDDGIHNWTSLNDIVRVYFHTKKIGELHVGLNMKSAEGSSTIRVTVGSTAKEIIVTNSDYQNVEIGVFDIITARYNYIEIQGLQKTGASIGDINKVLIGGPVTSDGIAFVPANFSFHFGRRGPSVHLSYQLPENKDIKYFYSEVNVSGGEDVVGSYFMANGFGEGYFGMQVNSDSERRILFSVWSPFTTDDPSTIPDDQKVIFLGKGEEVTIAKFGGEGSGGQSYKVFDWKPGNTYKFLLKGEPSVNNSTDYTAYFYAPEENEWKLIASFRRPHTSSHLKGFYSFLENFVPQTGHISRKGHYANQWAHDTEGNWHELTKAKFTADVTARNEARLDYAGGVEGDSFYLKNCGFFNENTPINSVLSRTASGTNPGIDFSQLPIPTIPVETKIKLLDKSTWSVVDYSTQEDKGGEGETGRAADVLDGDHSTYYHSCWSGCTASSPHHITIDMGKANEIDGFRFVQRQTLSRTVKDIEVQMSTDNVNWESLGEFVLQNVSSHQDINLTESKSFRYFKFIVKSAYDGTDNAAIAELSPYSL